MSCCGVRVHSLPHLAELLTHCPDQYATLGLQWSKVGAWALHSRAGLLLWAAWPRDPATTLPASTA